MRPSVLRLGRVSVLELRTELRAPLRPPPSTGCELVLSPTPSGLVVHFGERSSPVEGARSRDADLVEQLDARGLPRVAWLVQSFAGPGARLHLMAQVHEFATSFAWAGPTSLGVDELIVEELERRHGLRGLDQVLAWLQACMLLPPAPGGEFPRVVLSGRPGQDAGAAFRIHGEGHACDLRVDEREGLKLIRVVADSHRQRDPALLHLGIGELRFCDASVAARAGGEARALLDALVADADSYLGLWRSYNALECQIVLARARSLGALAYTKVERRSHGGYRFTLSEPLERGALASSRSIELEAGTELPPALRGGEILERGKASRPFTAKLEGVFGDRVELARPRDLELEPPPAGLLFLSLHGERVRLERQREAWEAIAACETPMPQLGLLLEGKAVHTRRLRAIQPQSRATRAVLPAPNLRQHEALRVALETPDIALIHGPPGTGKTRVIATLQARLAELDEPLTLDSFAGNSLLTSFQHAAVETVASATQVLGLPAIKVGRRSDDEQHHDGVERWRRDTAKTVRERRPPRADSSLGQALKRARQRVVAVLAAPASAVELTQVAAELAELAAPWLSNELALALAELAAPAPAVVSNSPAREAARSRAEALPVDEKSFFAARGPYVAYCLLRELEELAAFELEDAEREVLGLAADCQPTSPDLERLCSDLEGLRGRLLERLSPESSTASRDEPRARCEPVFCAVVDALHERLRDTPPGVDDALDSWLDALDNDPEGVRDALSHYTMVLAATCQHAASTQLDRVKTETAHPRAFRTVVVDEAARANPLDLMIPMARAQRRIVLVGDHRQLPHMLEPDVERELGDAESETRAQLGVSLFERLFHELSARQARDGIQRVVSLDTQYRMHPALGDLVSRSFYASEGVELRSPRAADEFAHAVELSDGEQLSGARGRVDRSAPLLRWGAAHRQQEPSAQV